MDYDAIGYVIGGIWFVGVGGLALFEQSTRKKEDGTYSAKSAVSYVLAALFFGPYLAGIYFGMDAMGLFVIFPPFAMWSFMSTIF